MKPFTSPAVGAVVNGTSTWAQQTDVPTSNSPLNKPSSWTVFYNSKLRRAFISSKTGDLFIWVDSKPVTVQINGVKNDRRTETLE